MPPLGRAVGSILTSPVTKTGKMPIPHPKTTATQGEHYREGFSHSLGRLRKWRISKIVLAAMPVFGSRNGRFLQECQVRANWTLCGGSNKIFGFAAVYGYAKTGDRRLLDAFKPACCVSAFDEFPITTCQEIPFPGRWVLPAQTFYSRRNAKYIRHINFSIGTLFYDTLSISTKKEEQPPSTHLDCYQTQWAAEHLLSPHFP